MYATQSTHKTLTALRQGSMIHVFDQDFDQKVAEPFHEAYMAHTSTSPNYQILASLDLGRRQVALEGVELVQRQIENAMQLRDAIDNHPLLSKYMRCLRTSDLIPESFRPSAIAQPLRSGLRNMMAAWEQDEFVLDPSRITLFIGNTGYDGDTFKRQQLMDRYGIQINKTSRNSVLFMTNIGTTRSSVAFLVEVLVNIARELDQSISEMSLGEREHFERAVHRLTKQPVPLPDFSGFHPAFLDHSGSEPTPEGDVRPAFYLSYDDTNCEYLSGEQIDERLDAGVDIVSATFVTPYPPGFPVLVPGQVFSREILQFMRDLDTPKSTATYRISAIACTPKRPSRSLPNPSGCRSTVTRPGCGQRRTRRKRRRKSRRSAAASKAIEICRRSATPSCSASSIPATRSLWRRPRRQPRHPAYSVVSLAKENAARCWRSLCPVLPVIPGKPHRRRTGARPGRGAGVRRQHADDQRTQHAASHCRAVVRRSAH